MKIDSKAILKTSAVATAVAALATMAWKIGDYTEVRPIIKKEFILAQTEADKRQIIIQAQIEEISKLQLVITFKSLDQKRQNDILSFEEVQERCAIAKVLEYSFVEGCGK